MSPKFKISESSRDDELAIIKKRVQATSSFSFETPNRAFKDYGQTQFTNSPIQEITVKTTEQNLKSIYEGKGKRRLDAIRAKWLDQKINLTIFDLTVNEIPQDDQLRIFSHYMYEASDLTFTLPTIKTSLLQDKILKTSKKTGKNYFQYKFNDDKFNSYLSMLNFILSEAELWNNKEIVGTIPLLAPKYTDPIIELYNSKDIQSFVIDCGLKNILSTRNITHLKTIISKIIEQDRSSLSNKLIYACNLGIDQFENYFSRADDFLSIFAYIDALGNTFKTRYFEPDPTTAPKPPRVKLFSREEYGYNLFGTYLDASKYFGFKMNRAFVKNHDQYRQNEEAQEIRIKLGSERILEHIKPKKSIDETITERLKDVASSVNPE